MLKINETTLNNLSAEAKQSARKRKNLNIHKDLSDAMQRLLNAMEPNTYVQPHKHESPDKRELFTIIRGKAIVVEFDDHGSITDIATLSTNNNTCAAEIKPRTYHTIISLEPDTILFEIKDGPYNPNDDKNFATWAPKENTPEAQDYLQELAQRIERFAIK